MKSRINAQKPKKATRMVHLLPASGCTNTCGYMNVARPLASTNTNTAAMTVRCNSRRSRWSRSLRSSVAMDVALASWRRQTQAAGMNYGQLKKRVWAIALRYERSRKDTVCVDLDGALCERVE